MSRANSIFLLFLLALLAFSSAALGGTFFEVEYRLLIDPDPPPPDPAPTYGPVEPYAITHPLGFDGTGGHLFSKCASTIP